MRIVKERAIEMHFTARIYLHTDTHHTEVRRDACLLSELFFGVPDKQKGRVIDFLVVEALRSQQQEYAFRFP